MFLTVCLPDGGYGISGIAEAGGAAERRRHDESCLRQLRCRWFLPCIIWRKHGIGVKREELECIRAAADRKNCGTGAEDL